MATNKYTRPVLLSNLKSISPKNFNTYKSFVSSFSPRAGVNSAKITALENIVGTAQLFGVFTGSGVKTKRILISFFKNI